MIDLPRAHTFPGQYKTEKNRVESNSLERRRGGVYRNYWWPAWDQEKWHGVNFAVCNTEKTSRWLDYSEKSTSSRSKALDYWSRCWFKIRQSSPRLSGWSCSWDVRRATVPPWRRATIYEDCWSYRFINNPAIDSQVSICWFENILSNV